MKKILALILTCLLAFSVTGVTAAPAEETENLLPNGDFEAVTEGWADGWSPKNGDRYISIDDKTVYDGEYAARISVSDGTWHHLFRGLSNLIPRATYRITAYVRTEATNKSTTGFCIKCYIPEGESERFCAIPNTQGKFVKQTYDFTLPDACTNAAVLIRQFGDGTTWVDNIEVTLLEEPELFAIDSFEIGDVFHYPHEETGYAWMHMSSYYQNLDAGKNARVDFELLDGEKVLDSQKDTPYIDGKAEYRYDISLLTEKKKAYVVRATAKYKDQKRIYTQNVYVYDRPSIIEDGGVVRIEGEVFNPVMGYHVYETDFKKVSEAGINVVQFGMGGGQNYTAESFAACDRLLADMDKYGIKALFVLYDGGVAASERNYEYTKAFVQRYKDDPRIYAWAICDEPFDGNYNPEMRDMMEKSYRLVRDIDSMHPVHLTNVVTETPKFCDIYTVDAYAYTEDTKGITAICERLQAAHKGEVLWQYLGSTFTSTKGDPSTLPSVKRVRGSMYRALESGMKGIGYYTISDAVHAPEGEQAIGLYDTDRWDGVVAFGQNEVPVLFDIFVHKKYALVNQYNGGNTQTGPYWSTWTDGKVVYLLLNNKGNSKTTIRPSMESANGLVTIENFEIERIGGTTELPKNKKLPLFEMEPFDTAMFRLTPKKNIDLSLLGEQSFRDLDGYEWAEADIMALAEKNIVNAVGENQYGPDQNITRADFAMFLIRTLGLTSDSTELFADVPADAYYAKELATGKALGLLKGVDDTHYNPNAEISRQDMMTICHRGLTLVGKNQAFDDGILEKFLDKSAIVVYAIIAVRDMTGMGIVKGDPSGNVNPLGNTTRAEAAVIMNRILGL